MAASEPRDFDKEFDYSNHVGVSFILAGYEFHTKPVASAAPFLSEKTSIEFAVEVIGCSLVPDDREVFFKMLADPDVVMTPHQLDAIGSWLIEELSGRPTGSPDSSGGGSGRVNTTSKAKLSEAAGGTGA